MAEKENNDNLIGLPSLKEQQPTQDAAKMEVTHFAIDVKTCAGLRRLLGKGHDYDEVAHLVRGLEAGAPLCMGPPAKQ